MTSINSTNVGNEINVDKKQKEQEKKDSGGMGLFMATLMLLAILVMCMSIYENRRVLGALYFGVSTLLLILLLYVSLCVGYVVSRYRIRKQVISKYGLVDRKILKTDLEKNKYCKWFTDSLLFTLIMGSLFLLFFEVFINIILNSGSVFSDLFLSLFYFVSDFFGGSEVETVTYVGESKCIYSERVISKGRSEPRISGYYMVNFLTSSGDLLTLSVNGDHLSEIRAYSNAEIKYISRTNVYVP